MFVFSVTMTEKQKERMRKMEVLWPPRGLQACLLFLGFRLSTPYHKYEKPAASLLSTGLRVTPSALLPWVHPGIHAQAPGQDLPGQPVLILVPGMEPRLRTEASTLLWNLLPPSVFSQGSSETPPCGETPEETQT